MGSRDRATGRSVVIASAWSEAFLPLYWRGRFLGFSLAATIAVALGYATDVFTPTEGLLAGGVTLLTTALLYIGQRVLGSSSRTFRLLHLLVDVATVPAVAWLAGAEGAAIAVAYPMVVVAHTAISGVPGGVVATIGSLLATAVLPATGASNQHLLVAMLAWTLPFVVWVVASLRGAYERNVRRIANVRLGADRAHGAGSAGDVLGHLADDIRSATSTAAVLIGADQRPDGNNGLVAGSAEGEGTLRTDLIVDVLAQRRVSEVLAGGDEVTVRRVEANRIELEMLDAALASRLDVVRFTPLRYSDHRRGVMAVGYADVAAADDLDERAVLAVHAAQAQSVLARLHGQELTSEVNRIKVAFLSAAGHGIITPLTSGKGLVELLASNWRDFSDTDRDRYLRTALDSLSRLELLTEQLSDLERLLRDDPPLPPKPVRLADAVAVRLARSEVELRERHVTVDVASTLHVLADHLILDRVLAHLLLNATQATEAGGAIAVRAIRLGDAVALEVADDGRGMDPHELARARELFARGPEHEASGNGMGVGLAFVERFVTRDGGSLTISSRPGEGTRVTVTLPLSDRTTLPLSDRTTLPLSDRAATESDADVIRLDAPSAPPTPS